MAGPSALFIAGLSVVGFGLSLAFIGVLMLVKRRRPVSTVSDAERQRERTETPQPLRQLTRQDLHRMQLRYTRNALRKRREVENSKLKLEIQKLQTENARLRQISDGQKSGIREFLEREAQKKPVTRKTVTKLLGKDSTLGYVAIGEVQEKMEKEAATPVATTPVLQH